jgi:hypothetical protein
LRLSIEKGKGVHDPLDTYQSVLPADRVRKTPEDLFSANSAIDDDMTDMDSIAGTPVGARNGNFRCRDKATKSAILARIQQQRLRK